MSYGDGAVELLQPLFLCLADMPTNLAIHLPNGPFCDGDRKFSGAFLYSINWKILARPLRCVCVCGVFGVEQAVDALRNGWMPEDDR